MPVNLEYGHAEAGWQVGDKGLTVFIPVPYLAGTSTEVLYPESIECVSETADWLHAENEAFTVIIGKARVTEGMEAAATGLYERLLAVASSERILRIWNYVPRINEWVSGEENYRSYCSGRAMAFAAIASSDGANYPAASAVGCNGDELVSILIAAKSGKACHFENPLQCPAYEYPPQYGANAPMFARATSWKNHSWALYISGTSSVSGYETVFPLDIDGQLRVTAENLRAITNEAGMHGIAGDLPKPNWVKVYIRDANDLPKIELFLAKENWLVENQFSIVHADICRSDLLVEIELSWLVLKERGHSCPRRA